MNDQMKQELLAWLTSVRQLAEQGKDFVLQQAPMVVQEKITWGRATETLWAVAAFLVFAVSVYLAMKAWRWVFSIPADEQDGHAVAGIFASIPAVCLFFVFMSQLETALQVWLAPRLYIIDWVVGLVKGV